MRKAEEHMKRAIRYISLILAAIFISALFVGCTRGSGDDTTASGAATSGNTAPEETSRTHDENGYLLDSLPADLNFGGEKVTVLYWNDAPFTDFEAEQSDDKIINAINTRNASVAERLGITFDWVGIPGNTKNRESYATTVRGSTGTGAGDFDLLAAHSLVGQDLFLQGLLCNLNDVKYLDFGKPWWPKQLTEAASVGNKLCFASGDISTNMLWYMTVMFYNVSLAKTYGIEDLHDTVLSGKWTLEKMETVIKDAYRDTNANGVKDVGDNFGLYCPNTTLDSFLFGSGIRVIDHDDKDMPKLSDDYGSEKTIKLVEDLCSLFYTSNDAMTAAQNNSTNFASGEYILYSNYAHNAANAFKDVTFDMSVLPFPKYDEAQKDYITTESFSYSIYMIPRDAKNTDKSGAVMEALASAAYRTTTPAIFEASLKLRYALNNKTSQVYDIIKSNICFDLGRMFGANLDNKTHVAFRNAIAKNNPAWAVTYAELKNVLNAKLKDLFGN